MYLPLIFPSLSLESTVPSKKKKKTNGQLKGISHNNNFLYPLENPACDIGT